MTNFTDVTELSGDEVSTEQVERIAHRYIWAADYCRNKDVAEVACGTGQGLGILDDVSKTLKAGDFSQEILNLARKHYCDRVKLERFDAQNMPYEEGEEELQH